MRSFVPLLILAIACETEPPTAQTDGVIVGVHTDPIGPVFGSARVTVKQDDRVVREETIPVAELPKELALSAPLGAKIDAFAEALPIGDGAPIITRLASARVVPGRKLLRVPLEGRCAAFEGLPSSFGICDAPMTCVGGACQSSEVALEDYETGWAAAPPDICRPAGRGAPEVQLGTGQTDYGTLADNQLLQLERGPQGGHHVWIAVRMRNLRQSGSATSITSRILDDAGPVPPAAFVFTFDRDEGGYCKLWGLRYQVDAGEVDLSQAYKRFLGKKLEVTVSVKDSTSASASATKVIQLGDKLLCPDGSTNC